MERLLNNFFNIESKIENGRNGSAEGITLLLPEATFGMNSKGATVKVKSATDIVNNQLANITEEHLDDANSIEYTSLVYARLNSNTNYGSSLGSSEAYYRFSFHEVGNSEFLFDALFDFIIHIQNESGRTSSAFNQIEED